MGVAVAKPSFPRLQRGRLLSRGLVAAFPLYEGSGTIAHDVSGRSGQGGTLTNGPTWAVGRAGWAVSFPGTGTPAIECAQKVNLGIAGTNKLSISAWAKRATATANIVFAWQEAQFVFGVGVNGTSNANQFKMTKYGVVDIFCGSFPADTNWHHVVGTWGASGETVYIDGAVNGTAGDTANFNSAGTDFGLWVGGVTGSDSNYTNGLLDDVRFYNRTLSAAEVREIFMGQG